VVSDVGDSKFAMAWLPASARLSFLSGRILEIAPGYGRWTQFLQTHYASLIGIDLARSCVDYCHKRFANYPNLEFKVNEGLTLPMIENRSIDFAFSFDSLVHAEADVISSYVNELARVLRHRGESFFLSRRKAQKRSRSIRWILSTHFLSQDCRK